MLCSSGGEYRGEQGEAGHLGHGGTGEVPHSYSQLLQANIHFCIATDPYVFGPSGPVSGSVKSEVRIRGSRSGSVQKCHGSATLPFFLLFLSTIVREIEKYLRGSL